MPESRPCWTETVKNYVSNVMAKWGMSRRSEAAAQVRVEGEHERAQAPQGWGES